MAMSRPGPPLVFRRSELARQGEREAVQRVPGGQPVEKWFASKFCSGPAAYDYLVEEFDWLAARPEAKLARSAVPFLGPRNNQRTIQAPSFAVNAHSVEGWAGRWYLCCEGPNASSVYDFWEMVWQENAAAVLMLNTPFEERLFPKTYNPKHETIQYWPLNPGEVKERNPITNPPPRQLLHICYYRWPDGEIPLPPAHAPGDYAATASGLVDLLRCELGVVPGPIVVHCHAGIGRTGVAVALDIGICRLLNRGFADVRDTVRRIRAQRPKSVANVWQYAFVNLALARLALDLHLLPDHPSNFKLLPLGPPPIKSVAARGQDSGFRRCGRKKCVGIPIPLPRDGPDCNTLLVNAWEHLAADFNDLDV